VDGSRHAVTGGKAIQGAKHKKRDDGCGMPLTFEEAQFSLIFVSGRT